MRTSSAFLSMSLQQFNIKDIFSKDYQNRNQFQHRFALKFLQPYFSTLPASTIKLIAFFMTVLQPNQQSQSSQQKNYNGIVIQIPYRGQQFNPEVINSYQMIKNQRINLKNSQCCVLFISYDNYLSCMELGQTSIEQQLMFFNKSQYLCSMPKKKYFNIIRNSKVLSFSFRQNIYFEGQTISSGESGSGVYLVRQGQFGYFKQIKGKNVEVFRFSEGHLLGTIELDDKQTKRLFTVKSKSSRCVVYYMSEQFFKSFIKPYCQKVIEDKQKKLYKFLSQKSKQINQFHQIKSQFNLVTLRKSMAHQTDLSQTFRNSKSINMFTSRDLPNLIKTSRKSVQIQQNQLRKTSYFQIKHQGPLKNYPLTIQRAKFTSSQFKDLEKLLQKNQKINKIRQIKKQQNIKTKQEILFDMFETSWKFDKEKKRRMRKSNNFL